MMRPDTPSDPDVTIYIASADTAACTELAVRTAVRYAGMPHRLVVGDGGSTDGSIAMLKGLCARGLLEVELAESKRGHADWLDGWLHACPTRWAVFVDSDVEFHRPNWLRDLVAVADRGGYAMVSGEHIPAAAHVIEPVDHNEVYLAERPAPWLLLVESSTVRELGVSFRFVAQTSSERPEGTIAYDVGAMLFAALVDAGLGWTTMPPAYRRAYTHYGNMSWADKFGGGRAHRAKIRRVARRLQRAQRHHRV